ncbi:MAG: LysM peptidoglycan-binding domain-containing protein [Chloroflexota bacterium]
MGFSKVIPVTVALALLAVVFGAPTPAAAWSGGCGASYVVQWGDTLGSVAGQCGTSVAALRLANPGLGYWLYAGQTLWLPGAYQDGEGSHDTYYVARGDTLKKLAARFGTTMDAIARLNNIWNYNLIYEGQRLLIPGSGWYPPTDPPSYPPPTSGTYVVQWGDTMRKIAARFDVRLSDLIAANPHISNPNLIYRGQVIYLPGSGSLHTVQRGDTLKKIASRYGTTLSSLISLNPQIRNANLIYPGQVIRIW